MATASSTSNSSLSEVFRVILVELEVGFGFSLWFNIVEGREIGSWREEKKTLGLFVVEVERSYGFWKLLADFLFLLIF